MPSVTFWTAVGASGTVGAALGAVLGVFVAWNHLRQISIGSRNEALLRLYVLFDEQTARFHRRTIWNEIEGKTPSELSDAEWDIVERTATDMDVVATFLKHRLINKEVIFERYAEVLVPLWKAIGEMVAHRREAKGGWGWNNLEWLGNEVTRWSIKYRGTDSYVRFATGEEFSGKNTGEDR